MADIIANGVEKGANGEATLSESQPSLPPVVKSPLNAGEDSMVPSIATTTATANTEPAASTELAAQNDSAVNSKEELTEKLEAADKLASQPEKPTDNAPEQPAVSKTVTETATTDGPSLPNGEAKEPPKPVTVEEIRDQDMPAAPLAQPSEMTGALPVGSPSDDAAKDEPVKATTETDTTEVTTGDKRKAGDAEVANGDATSEEPLEKAPVEKKQKTNGATTNGAPKKVGRPRKEKNAVKPPPSVGRAARKTRSQGAAD